MNIIQIFQSFTPKPSQQEPAEKPALPRHIQDNLESILGQTDRKIYGMDFELLTKIIHDPQLQLSFESDFGITLEEYLERKSSGEMMGDTQVNGKWISKTF